MRKSALDEFHSREAIRNCLYRFARGIDRADEAALTSTYWPDAVDSHGAYSGPVSGFIEKVKAVWAAGARNIHHITNILIEFDGPNRAVVESYFLALQRGTAADGAERQVQLSGRYCDVFEMRNNEWRVARRIVVYDWVEPQLVPDNSEEARFGLRTPIGAAFPHDPIYSVRNIVV